MSPNWKLERIKSLNDEVKEVHPVLHELFRRMPNIVQVNYTQGNRENGADFVLVKKDEVLLDDDYVGVIVKSTPIKQDHEDVNRQIRECELPRPISGGAKEIVLSEIWVITSKNITRSAQDHILHGYKSKKIKFIDADRLVVLIDGYYSDFWEIANLKLNKYISSQKESIRRSEGQHSLLPAGLNSLDFQCQIEKKQVSDKRRFRSKKTKPSTLLKELKSSRCLFLEGGMGAGKSELLRSTAKQLCEYDSIESINCVPYLTTYRDLKDSGLKAGEIFNKVQGDLGEQDKDIVFFIDSFDETVEDIAEKADFICGFVRDLSALDNARVVVASRPIHEEKVIDKIGRSFDVYDICPLSYGMVINIVEKLCSNIKVGSKFKDDLQNSHLMKALPKTPLSAILLGRLLAENIKELPSTLPELYSKYTDLVLGRWDIQKGNGSEKEYETIQRITATVAAYMLDNDLEFLGLGELSEIFKSYLSRRRTGQDAAALISAFLSRHEIIGFSESRNAIFFKHKTFKEFFHATMLLQQKGIEAPINNPFDIYWQGVEYFYLGLVKDAPSRIESLSKIQPEDDIGTIMKISSMGDFLLAAYQTPYEQIEGAIAHSFKEAAKLYVDVTYNGKESWLNNLPELQLLCLMTMTVRNTYAYDFFRPALHEAKMLAEIESGALVEQRNIEIFLIDTVLAALGDENAFVSLGDKFESSLDWVVKLGISFASNDVGLVNIATKRMTKRISKASKNNRAFHAYLEEIQETPIKERKRVL